MEKRVSGLLGIHAESQFPIFPYTPPPLGCQALPFPAICDGRLWGAPLFSGLLITAYGHWEKAGFSAPGNCVDIPWAHLSSSLCGPGLCCFLPWARGHLCPQTRPLSKRGAEGVWKNRWWWPLMTALQTRGAPSLDPRSEQPAPPQAWCGPVVRNVGCEVGGTWV